MRLKYAIRAIILAGAGIALVAPFTFLKPVFTVPAEPEVTLEPPVAVVVPPKVIEQPLHDVKLPDFAAIRDVKAKKRAFFAFISPSVMKENQRLLTLKAEVEVITSQLSLGEPLNEAQAKTMKELVKSYRVSKRATPLQQAHELSARVDVIPSSLVLVQAANESAWGTSRFARIGLNFFGIWCYKPGCGMVPRSRNKGAKHEVEAFDSVDEAVTRYLHNINTNSAYSVFRTIRKQLREQDQPLIPEILATGLLPYSERGTDYVLELTEMLRHNRAYFVQPAAQSINLN